MIAYLKREKVLDIAFVLAILSAFFVHPDKTYLEYVDLRVLALLFCLMVLVRGFQNAGVLDFLIVKLFGNVKSSRSMSRILICICFFSSMIITNDVALITFVPFAIQALSMSGQQKRIIPVVVLLTIAANLGSMLTPIGNPQNLYLFTASKMNAGVFFRVMFPVAAVSFVILILAVLLMPNEEIRLSMDSPEGNGNLKRRDITEYAVLFALNLLVVFRVLSWIPALCITVAVLLVLKKKELFKGVDYALLLTFVGFFVFVGNIGRVPFVSRTIEDLLEGREIWMSAVFSQFLSNVPAALLLSGFTDRFADLMVGCNIGGLGTLIASMASLISYKAYAASKGSDKGKYMITFTLYNAVGLIILLVFAAVWYR